MPSSSGRPLWVGTALDKIAITIVPIAQFIITIPLLIWALIVAVVSAIASFVANAYVWLIMFAIWITLLFVVILWDPLIGVILQALWPVFQFWLFAIFVLINVLYIILITLIVLWNSLVPLLTLVVVYCVDFFLTCMHLLANLMKNEEMTQLFYDSMEIAWFYVDIGLNTMLLVLGVLPANLTAVVNSINAVLYYAFKAVSFLAPLVAWVFFTLWRILPPILHALQRLVHTAHSVLGVGAFVSRSLLSFDNSAFPGSGGSSSRYDDSIHAFASELIHHGQFVEWDKHLESLNNLTSLMDSSAAPAYLHLDDLFLSSSSPHLASGPPVALAFDELRPLHVRFRQRGALWHAELHDDRIHLTSAESTHTRAVRALNEHATAYNNAQRHSLYVSSPAAAARESGNRAVFDELNERFVRGSRAVEAVTQSLHSVIDRAPPLSSHIDAVKRTADGVAKHFGFSSGWHALDHYQRNYRSAWHLLESVVPDVTEHPMFKMIIDANPEQNRDHRMWHFEWKRSMTPVSGFHNSAEINRAISWQNPQTEQASVPTLIPPTVVADCYTTHPRNILCIPVPPPKLRFREPIFKVPTDLSRDCPCFRPVPNLLADGTYSVWKFLNPIDVVVDTYCWVKIFLGFFVTVVLFFDHALIKYPVLSTIINFFFIFQDPKKGPLDTNLALCLLAFVFYPYTVVFLGYTIGIFWPAVRGFITTSYLYIIAVYNSYASWRGRLLDWYRQTDVSILGYSNFAPTQQTADRMFLQPMAFASSQRVRFGKRPMQLKSDIVVPGSGTEYSLHVQGGIDETIAQPAVGAGGATTTVADPLLPEYEQEMHTLQTALASSQQSPDSLAACIAILEAPLRQLQERHEAAVDKLQRWADVAHHHGLLVEHITHVHNEDSMRWKFSRGRAPVGSYQFTIPYIQDVFHNIGVQRKCLPASQLIDVPL